MLSKCLLGTKDNPSEPKVKWETAVRLATEASSQSNPLSSLVRMETKPVLQVVIEREKLKMSARLSEQKKLNEAEAEAAALRSQEEAASKPPEKEVDESSQVKEAKTSGPAAEIGDEFTLDFDE